MLKTGMLLALSVAMSAGVIADGAMVQDETTIERSNVNERPEDCVSEMADTETCDSESNEFFGLPFVPPGACELPNGDCVVTLDTICRVAGGEFQGANTVCD